MTKLLHTTGLILLSIFTYAQTTITIGTGTNTNGDQGYPAPYGNYYDGAKHQFIILESELTAAGMSAGNINSIAFDVDVAEGTPLTNFTIGMKLTSTATTGATFETGMTNVYGPTNFTETTGWNVHTFGTPFYWDGTSNIIVETCFNNTNWTNNAEMRYTTTSFVSCGYYRQDNNNNLCSETGTTLSSNRPNMQFDWAPINVPPIANFSANPTTTCSGVVDFTDLSTYTPTGWLWDFGDGNTSTVQNPTHTYTTSGTYDVMLTATNAYGSDDTLNVGMITVNVGSSPIAASCMPATTNHCCGFGITNVTFNTLNNTSGDGSEGYGDFTCTSTTVFEGSTYTIDVATPNPSTHNCAAWIDYNNDGTFSASEEILNGTSALSFSANVTIPGGAVLNTPLRMRVSADYDLSAPITPCGQPDYGQVEDYTVIITQNTTPPVAEFSVSDTVTCDGYVEFTDLSANIPYGWNWDFGDGNNSVQQDPTHTYTASGTYTVTLSAYNAHGTDDTTMTALIEVNLSNAVAIISCEPATLGYCCDYGIENVTFESINHSSGNASEGYQDNTCEHQTDVWSGNSHSISITTGPSNPQDTKIWIDFNNDGVLDDATELVFTALNTSNPSGTINIPGTAVQNTPLRMRITSDMVGATITPCSDNSLGQTEDYGVVVIPDPTTYNTISETGCGQYTVPSGDETYFFSGTYNDTIPNAAGADSVLTINLTISLNTFASVNESGCGSYTSPSGNYVWTTPGSYQDTIPNANGCDSIMNIFLSFDDPDTTVVVSGATLTATFSGATYQWVDCDNGYTAIPGATDQNYTATADGNYAVIITNNGCADTSSCHSIIANSISENPLSNVTLYPNPTEGITTINFGQIYDNVNVDICYLNGAVIRRQNFNGVDLVNLNLSDLATGVYYVRVSNEVGSINLPLFVK